MYSFKNDYSEGAHENIIGALVKSNLEQSQGYGEDNYCEEAKKLIKGKLSREDVDIHFLVGGTQTNLTALSAFLKSYEAIVAPSTGHILVHETGAIEATGHKVISVDSADGKITPKDVELTVKAHTDEHMVKPKLVYISNPTEVGTLYTKEELEALRNICNQHGMYLYMDGARLASALTSKENNLVLNDICNLVDAFYIGGTKCGALMGEALVIVNENFKSNFRYYIKQRGAMFAKGRILGIQFLELFRENLYFLLGEYSNKMADKLRLGIEKAGHSFFINTSTNQVFPIFSNELIESLENNFDFSIWEKIDDKNSAIRLVTSWATCEEEVDKFIKSI